MKNFKLKALVSLVSLVALLSYNVSSVFAVKVGEISVENNTGEYTITSPVDIDWDGAFNGNENWSWSLTGIKVTAEVKPIINMKVSKPILELWDITGIEASSTLNIEVGTNSPSWVVVKAISQSGWLVNTDLEDNSIVNNAQGGIYKFSSISGWDTKTTVTFLDSKDITESDKEAVIYKNTAPEVLKNDTAWAYDIEFKITAKAQETAAPWSYEDYITFLVVANF